MRLAQSFRGHQAKKSPFAPGVRPTTRIGSPRSPASPSSSMSITSSSPKLGPTLLLSCAPTCSTRRPANQPRVAAALPSLCSGSPGSKSTIAYASSIPWAFSLLHSVGCWWTRTSPVRASRWCQTSAWGISGSYSRRRPSEGWSTGSCVENVAFGRLLVHSKLGVRWRWNWINVIRL